SLGDDDLSGSGCDGRGNGSGVARAKTPCLPDRGEALVAGADLGKALAERDGHVDDADAGPAGVIDGSSHPRQILGVARVATDDVLLNIHHQQGGTHGRVDFWRSPLTLPLTLPVTEY